MVKVKDFMNKDVLTARKNELVKSVARKIEKSTSDYVLIVERQKPIGIITERDLIKFFTHSRKKHAKVKDIMKKAPVITVDFNETLNDVIEIIKREGVKQIPVMKKNKIVGIITEECIIEGSIKSEGILTKKLMSGRIKQKTYAKKQMSLFQDLHEIKKAHRQVGTGAIDLDKFLNGGLPYGKNILISGMPGAGKSVFAYSFLAQGLRDGDICVYVYSNETENEIKEGLKFVNLENVEEYIEKGKLIFLHLKDTEDKRVYNAPEDLTAGHLYNIKEAIKKALEQGTKGKQSIRFVLNILMNLLVYCDSKTVYRFLSEITGFLKKDEISSLFLLQTGTGDPSVLNAIEELMNVVIELKIKEVGMNIERYIRVKKSESANFPSKGVKFEFKKDKGFCILKD